MTTLREDLVKLVNKHSREIRSNTPDFILADVMHAALVAFEDGVRARDTWYDISPSPGQSNLPDGPPVIPPPADTKTEVESAPTLPAPIATPALLEVPVVLAPFIDDSDSSECADDDHGVPF